jgi:hypothetical protein
MRVSYILKKVIVLVFRLSDLSKSYTKGVDMFINIPIIKGTKADMPKYNPTMKGNKYWRLNLKDSMVRIIKNRSLVSSLIYKRYRAIKKPLTIMSSSGICDRFKAMLNVISIYEKLKDVTANTAAKEQLISIFMTEPLNAEMLREVANPRLYIG